MVMNVNVGGFTSVRPHVFYDRPFAWLDEDYDEEGLPDEVQCWVPEEEVWEDEALLAKRMTALPKLASILPSEFTEFAFRMPRADGQGYEHFSFEERRHMRQIYDTPARRILLCCGRQVEKSTLLGNKMLCYSCLIPSFKTLYVSPSMTQTKTFSSDRIKEPIETSPVLKSYTTNMLAQNVMEKQFVNRSKITLRYAFLNADRTRGIPAWMLLIDELQDILQDNIPIIEQCLSHAPKQWQMYLYAGTPKSLDNTIEYYRSEYSTQGEWVVPCDCKGGGGGRYWNILGEKNIGKKGLICEHCGKRLHAMHQDAQWAWMVQPDPKRTPFEGYRIPQLMVPWRSWDEILLDYKRYPRDKFYNEVLGISFDSGMRPLTQANVFDACNPLVSMHPEHLSIYQQKSIAQDVFAGIDWGTGENTYTVLTLGTYVDMKFRIFYIHRFIGEDLEPPVQLEKLVGILTAFNVKIIGTDYGGGFDRNDHLVRRFGPHKVQKFQYMARCKRKVEMDPRLRRFKVHRTEVMSDIFNAIKRKQIEFPRWEEFKEPYAQDMLNIFSEYNNTLHMIMYSHSPNRPDDAFHSILYCMLASMIVRPRPDIIAPLREDKNKGPLQSQYEGPIYQG